MKLNEISAKYNMELSLANISALHAWVPTSGYKYTKNFLGAFDIDDGQNFEEFADSFLQTIGKGKDQLARKQEQIEREKADLELATQTKLAAMASMLITSGFSFDGYTITKYSGYISGDDVVQIARGTSGIFSEATDVGASLMKSLAEIRRNALAELKDAALALGCNAVIGVDFDYLTLDPQTASSGGGTVYLPYVFGVTANGNAVIIEKSDRAKLT